MGHHSHSHHHNHNTSDGVSQRVNSPRFSGPMTRRGHSFKRNNAIATTATTTHNNISNNNENSSNGGIGSCGTNHEIDLQINSTTSESVDGFERQSRHNQYLTQRVHGGIVKSLLNKKGTIRSMMVDLGFRERKRLNKGMASHGRCLC